MSTDLKDDIFNHQLTIHNYDSFGRAIAYMLLQQVRQQMIENGPSEKNILNLPVRVEKWGNETKCWKLGIGDIWMQIPENK